MLSVFGSGSGLTTVFEQSFGNIIRENFQRGPLLLGMLGMLRTRVQNGRGGGETEGKGRGFIVWLCFFRRLAPSEQRGRVHSLSRRWMVSAVMEERKWPPLSSCECAEYVAYVRDPW